ncbi:MAG: hypothetical protein LBB18_02095 [Puniceicoccales bacterium]|nr:hypothetical protein [Puniceicoccales bacterium]
MDAVSGGFTEYELTETSIGLVILLLLGAFFTLSVGSIGEGLIVEDCIKI